MSDSINLKFSLLTIFLLLQIILTRPRTNVPQEIVPAPAPTPAPAPEPAPSCFPIKPTRRPLPTFSGPVVTVIANGSSSPGQFDYEVLNAVPGTTLQLDGSLGPYSLLNSTSVTTTLRITSVDPQQPAVIQNSTASNNVASIRVLGQSTDTIVLIDNVVIYLTQGNTGVGDRSAVYVTSGFNPTTSAYTPDVYVDNVQFYSTMISVLIRNNVFPSPTYRVQVTNCKFFPYEVGTYTTSNFVQYIIIGSPTDDCFIEHNFALPQRTTNSFGTAREFLSFQVGTNALELTDPVNICVNNNIIDPAIQLNTFFFGSFEKLYASAQPNFNFYVYDNDVSTRTFITLRFPDQFSSMTRTFNIKGNKIGILDLGPINIFPLLYFQATGPNVNATRFDTKFYSLDNSYQVPSSWVFARQVSFEQAIAQFDLFVAGFLKSNFQSVQGLFQGFTSIDCADAAPRVSLSRKPLQMIVDAQTRQDQENVVDERIKGNEPMIFDAHAALLEQ